MNVKNLLFFGFFIEICHFKMFMLNATIILKVILGFHYFIVNFALFVRKILQILAQFSLKKQNFLLVIHLRIDIGFQILDIFLSFAIYLLVYD